MNGQQHHPISRLLKEFPSHSHEQLQKRICTEMALMVSCFLFDLEFAEHVSSLLRQETFTSHQHTFWLISTSVQQMRAERTSSQNYGFLSGLFACDIKRFGHIHFHDNMFHACVSSCVTTVRHPYFWVYSCLAFDTKNWMDVDNMKHLHQFLRRPGCKNMLAKKQTTFGKHTRRPMGNFESCRYIFSFLQSPLPWI